MNNGLSYIEVLHPGIGCTVQDKGRFGYWSEGVPVSGIMDDKLAGLANLLVGNHTSHAVLEWRLKAPKLKFLAPCTIAVTGFDIQIFVNETLHPAFSIISIQKNDLLKINALKITAYKYLAISGGIQSEKILGSQSYYPNITSNAHLKKRLKLAFIQPSKKPIPKQSKLKILQNNTTLTLLEFLKGPEFYLLNSEQQNKLSQKLFSIHPQSNRMGYLLNETWEPHNHSIISSPVLPGTVQWTPSGQLIILMKDAQTVGGYPRILQLKNTAISRLARMADYDFIQFTPAMVQDHTHFLPKDDN